MQFLFQIQIPKRSEKCVECNKVFSAEEQFCSTLREENAAWLRRDWCLSCIPKISEARETRWMSRQSIKEKPIAIDEKDRGWSLLLELLKEEPLEQVEQEIVILALYLIRKKILIERKGSVEKEGRFWSLCEHIENGEMLLIPKIDLFQLDIPLLQKRIKNKLEAFDGSSD